MWLGGHIYVYGGARKNGWLFLKRSSEATCTLRMCDMQQPLEPFSGAILPYRMVNTRMACSTLFAARLKSRFRLAISTL
jgi:hypothetical protein